MRRVIGQLRAWPNVVLGVTEAALIATLWVANFRLFFSLHNPMSIVDNGLAAIGLTSIVIILMYTGGLYEREAFTNLKRAVWRSALITFPVFGLAVIATRVLATETSVPIYPYRWEWTLSITGLWLLLAISIRFLFRGFFRAGYFTQAILFVGSRNEAAELAQIVAVRGHYRIAGQVNPEQETLSEEMLLRVASSTRASRLVVKGDEGNPLIRDILCRSRLAGLKTAEYLDFYEREAGRLCLAPTSNELPALGRDFADLNGSAILRRGLDIFISVSMLLLTAPILLITAIAIKCQDGGPVFYRQARVGLRGRIFTLLKFRSMHVDAESDGPVWAAERDCRITEVGRIIRKMRIDELPQIFNVLHGEMAIVGPRPERPYFVEQLTTAIPLYDCRHLVRPGITGWAQVSFHYGASIEDARRKLSYDLYYVKHRSIVLDLWILLKTVGVVLRGEGAR